MTSGGLLLPQVDEHPKGVEDKIDRNENSDPNCRQWLRVAESILDVLPKPPPDDRLHVFINPPGRAGGAYQLQRYDTIYADAYPYKLWPAVTINAIAREPASLGSNEIVDLSGTEPDFLTQFISELERPRVESDTVCFFKSRTTLVIENCHKSLWLRFSGINLTTTYTGI